MNDVTAHNEPNDESEFYEQVKADTATSYPTNEDVYSQPADVTLYWTAPSGQQQPRPFSTTTYEQASPAVRANSVRNGQLVALEPENMTNGSMTDVTVIDNDLYEWCSNVQYSQASVTASL